MLCKFFLVFLGKFNVRQICIAMLILLVLSSTSVVGVVRLIVVAQLDDRNDITWNYIPAANWSLIEMNTGIMCACMPATAPAIKRVFQHWRGQSMAKISFVNADMPQGLSSGGDTVTLASLVHKSNTDLSPA